VLSDKRVHTSTQSGRRSDHVVRQYLRPMVQLVSGGGLGHHVLSVLGGVIALSTAGLWEFRHGAGALRIVPKTPIVAPRSSRPGVEPLCVSLGLRFVGFPVIRAVPSVVRLLEKRHSRLHTSLDCQFRALRTHHRVHQGALSEAKAQLSTIGYK